MSLAILGIIECCGHVERVSSSTMMHTRRRRSLDDAFIEFGTLEDYSSDSDGLFKKIDKMAKSLNLNTTTSRNTYDDDGKIGVKYVFKNVDCDEMTKFAEAVKDTIDFIVSARLVCGEIDIDI
ncbi:unnamed protein product [Caenorhabditis bovis]|uniref:Uncharacterized protein n=1 Tax=Caenorhabditis bovis TaxID=2654633 RepID=A0A8S1ELU7_9PELO|nr:unnamed protein product [Caenorhabditis bovis]CAB3398758.1 unnamed protein product [Caenorhabditis bovis]